MPEVSNVTLVLTESSANDNVTVRVDYDVSFNTFERQLSGLGLNYHSHVTIHDFDGDDPGEVVVDFFDPDTPHRFAVTVGNGTQVLPRQTETKSVLRSTLNVDPGTQPDEFKANVKVHANEMFDAFTGDELSDQAVLD